MTEDDLIDIGFTKKNYTFQYPLTRLRFLSAMSIGYPNETIWICCKEHDGTISDLVCIHNYDYDGYITKDRLVALLKWFDHPNKPTIC